MGLVYFGISGLLISLLTIRLLEDRGIRLGQLEEISILVLVSLGIIYNICLIPIHGPDSLLYICRLVFIFPFLISISIVDAATRWVYDIDILGGILVSELIFSLRILENLIDNINNVDKIGPLLYNNIIGLILLFGLAMVDLSFSSIFILQTIVFLICWGVIHLMIKILLNKRNKT